MVENGRAYKAGHDRSRVKQCFGISFRGLLDTTVSSEELAGFCLDIDEKKQPEDWE